MVKPAKSPKGRTKRTWQGSLLSTDPFRVQVREPRHKYEISTLAVDPNLNYFTSRRGREEHRGVATRKSDFKQLSDFLKSKQTAECLGSRLS